MHYFSAPNMEQKIFTFWKIFPEFRTFFEKIVLFSKP